MSTTVRRVAPAVDRSPTPGSAADRLGAALAVATAIGAAGTVAIPGVLRGPAVMQGSARGTALVMLVVAVPTLVAGIWRHRHGSDRALLGCLGACGYLVYNAVMLLFGSPFNRLFLVYVAILGLGLATLIALLTSADTSRIAALLAPAPARPVAVYLWLIAGGNLLVWLKVVVPGLTTSGSPAFLEGTGLTTNPIYVRTWRSGCRWRSWPPGGSGSAAEELSRPVDEDHYAALLTG
jgi:hypothetical protein